MAHSIARPVTIVQHSQVRDLKIAECVGYAYLSIGSGWVDDRMSAGEFAASPWGTVMCFINSLFERVLRGTEERRPEGECGTERVLACSAVRIRLLSRMILVKSLTAMATEKLLLKTSGQQFLDGVDYMYRVGLSPDRLSVMETTTGKFILQFHSRCDLRPFAANYPSFQRLLRGIVHIRAWRIQSIEFLNVDFKMADIADVERTLEKLEVNLVLLRNCTYNTIMKSSHAYQVLLALNRNKKCIVCEYGDDRLKDRVLRGYQRYSFNNNNVPGLNAAPVAYN
ncbi:unnamed protein product [Litomosoides sigmodontis]|uniref:Uncharacterized protein n=2 Tax=Onchocercidae TaxID=6296 RepID=A0A3P6UEH7_LITSI|nr:unnamed protein product [Litomosoides sigmodontis]